jgi:hypothetical protein
MRDLSRSPMRIRTALPGISGVHATSVNLTGAA